MLDKTHTVPALQHAYLNRVVPKHRVSRLYWAGGTTQLIEAGQGQPLLLIHGGLGEAFQWAPLMALLAQRHRVLAVDRPGHGLADPFDYRGVDLLSFGGDFIHDIANALQLPAAVVIGNSMGGLWSVGFALKHPQRVSHLILLGSPAGAHRGAPLMIRLGTLPLLRRAMRAGLARPTRDSVRTFWKLLVVHPERLPDDFLDLSVASQLRNHPSWISLLENAVDFRGPKPHLLLQAHWAKLQMPVTLLWGERDAWSPPEVGDAIAAAHPRVRMVRLANLAHAPWFDDAEAVARAVESALVAA